MAAKNKDLSFMGFETWFNNLRMILKMQLYIFLILFTLDIVALAVLFFYTFSDSQISIMAAYFKSKIALNDTGLTTVIIDGKAYEQTYRFISETYRPYVMNWIEQFINKGVWTFLIFLLWFPINYLFRKRAKSQTDSSYLRGAVLVTPAKLNKLMSGEKTFLPIGEVKMPVSAEVKHALIIGRPGVGKTVCMSRMLEKIIERGDRAIIHDFKGDYLQKFYRPDIDIIFNPLDARSHYWNFFNEIDSPVDVDAVGYALIPDAKGQGMDPFWNNAARDVFTGVVNHLIMEDRTTYDSLHLLLTSPSDIIGKALKRTPGSEAGATAIADPESKQTGSIMSVLTQYTKIFAYMLESLNPAEGRKSFTINDWLDDPKGGNIYITNYSTLQDTLAPILTLMIDLMGRKLLSLPDSSARRIFFMLDEFGALQRMQTITRLLTLARSKGGGVFLGIQDLGQIDKIYGREHKQTIVNACGSNIVFSVADADTAETLSKKYGEYLSIESYVTQSMGVDNNRDGISINQQKNRERIVMPSEIGALPDLNCYVQFPGYPVAKTALTYKHYEDKNEPFNKRKGLTYREMMTMEFPLSDEEMKAAARNIADETYDVERETDEREPEQEQKQMKFELEKELNEDMQIRHEEELTNSNEGK